MVNWNILFAKKIKDASLGRPSASLALEKNPLSLEKWIFLTFFDLLTG